MLAAITCPHCNVHLSQSEYSKDTLGTDVDGDWIAESLTCPSCDHIHIRLHTEKWVSGSSLPSSLPSLVTHHNFLAYPKPVARPLPPAQVPSDLVELFVEASSVATDSPRAAAALGRRCLQQLIHTQLGIRERTLNDEVDALLARKELPSHIADLLDGVRVVGNWAAHPIKSSSTGQIVDVEPGEVDVVLDVLESLFDFYFVLPAKTAARKKSLNDKLAGLGKPLLK